MAICGLKLWKRAHGPRSNNFIVHISQTTKAILTKLAENKPFYNYFTHCENE